MIRPSSKNLPMICRPTGSPSLKPQGMLMEGGPATEAGTVHVGVRMAAEVFA
jgi:hypothetical protein